MSNKLLQVKAWCSGKAYPIPDRVKVDCYNKRIDLWIGDCSLTNFYFRSKKEFWLAVKIVMEALKKG
jgi:hypothetical protein